MRQRINLVMRMSLCEKLVMLLAYEGMRSHLQEQVNRNQSMGGIGVLGFDLSKILTYYDVQSKHLTSSSQSAALMKLLFSEENNAYSIKNKVNMMNADASILFSDSHNVFYAEKPVGDLHLHSRPIDLGAAVTGDDGENDEVEEDEDDEQNQEAPTEVKADTKTSMSWRGNDYDAMQGMSSADYRTSDQTGVSSRGMTRYTEPMFALGVSGFDSMDVLFDPKTMSALRWLHAGDGVVFKNILKIMYNTLNKRQIQSFEKALSDARLYEHFVNLTTDPLKVNKFKWNAEMRKSFLNYDLHKAAENFIDMLLRSLPDTTIRGENDILISGSFLTDASDPKMQQLESIYKWTGLQPNTLAQRYKMVTNN